MPHTSVDIKDIYNQFFTQILDPSLNLEETIGAYFRACPPHQHDQKIAYIVHYDDEFHYLESQENTADQHRPSTSGWIPEPLPAHSSTSASYRRDQLQDHIESASWRQRPDWGQLQGRVPTSTALPRCHLDQDWGTSDKEHPTSIQKGVVTTSRVWAQPAYTSTAAAHQWDWACLEHHWRADRQVHLQEGAQPTDQQYTSVWPNLHQWTSQQQRSQPREPHQPRDHLDQGRSSHQRLPLTWCTSSSGRNRQHRHQRGQWWAHQARVHRHWQPTSSTQREPPSPSSTATTWKSTDIRGCIKTSTSQSATSMTSIGQSTSSVTSEAKVCTCVGMLTEGKPDAGWTDWMAQARCLNQWNDPGSCLETMSTTNSMMLGSRSTT